MKRIHILTERRPADSEWIEFAGQLHDLFGADSTFHDRETSVEELTTETPTALIIDGDELSFSLQAVLRELKLEHQPPLLPIIVLNDAGCAPCSVAGIKIGADHYIDNQSSGAEVARSIAAFYEELKQTTEEDELLAGIIFLTQNKLEYLFEVNNIISRLFADAGLLEDEIINLRLTLDELGTNAIRHGNGNDPEKMVTFTCKLTRSHLVITIEDQGPGFSVSDIPDPTSTERILLPSGRGIFIARQLMDHVCYHGPGNKVEFVKQIHCPC